MTGRQFGSVRVLPSGRVQARYIAPDGLRRTAPMTFESKAAARRWLRLCESDIVRGTWVDVRLSTECFAEYAARWVAERPGLSERTRELYGSLLRLHLVPFLGGRELRQITPAVVRTWRQDRLDAGVGASTVAKAYRLLRAVLHTAVDDEVIVRNPCRIAGAAVERPEERPVLTVAQVHALADAIEPRFRALVLLAAYGSLRWGELMGLRRSDLDLVAGTVRIERAVTQVGGRFVVKEPKTGAGRRVVALPGSVLPDLRSHLEQFAEPGPDGRVFVGSKGATQARNNFVRPWSRALVASGLDGRGIHFHDLRHTGNHWAATTGASTRELMARMGHASVAAALIYQHSTAGRDRQIADALDDMARAADVCGHVRGTAPDHWSEEGPRR